MTTLSFIIASIVIFIVYTLYTKTDAKKRESYLESYKFPQRLSETLLRTYPHLSSSDVELVIRGLREYFYVCNIAGKRMVAMPSQAVDVVWHEFILFTREYDSFCQKGLGRFLHHTPAEAMKSKNVAQEGIKTAWRISCHRENINVKSPSKLPLLFALDAMLAIEDGFFYSLNCSAKDASGYCAGDIGCGGGCAGDSGGTSDSSSSSDGGSGCGGGCGGS